MTAILSRPDEAEEEDEEEEAPAAGPPPARVFVVFRGVSWEDPQGGLRESDSIQGVFACEEAARRAVAAREREGGRGGGVLVPAVPGARLAGQDRVGPVSRYPVKRERGTVTR